jgi:hypothetical protein
MREVALRVRDALPHRRILDVAVGDENVEDSAVVGIEDVDRKREGLKDGGPNPEIVRSSKSPLPRFL